MPEGEAIIAPKLGRGNAEGRLDRLGRHTPDCRGHALVKLAASITRSLQADMRAELRDIERAASNGTRDAGRGLKTELRRQVASAGLGQRLANSWRDKHYPNQKLDAASLVYTKAPQKRNVNWAEARGRWDVASGLKKQAQIDELIAFFRARMGKAYGFRFKDWTDYKASGQPLGDRR